MSRELTLFLVRHGETVWNAEGRYQGTRDIPLSERGREQAIALRDRLALAWELTPPPPDAVFSSHLSRAYETAQILSQSLASPPEIQQLPLLRERSYGEWEGLTNAEIRERFGPHAKPVTAESSEAVQTRILEAFAHIWEHTLHDRTHGIALVVGHGASLRYFLARALEVGAEPIRRFQMDNTGLSLLTFRGDTSTTAEGRLLFVNNTAHLIPRTLIL